MHYIQGKHREQSTLFPHSLDEIIDADNEVRIIDLFVERGGNILQIKPSIFSLSFL